MSLARRRPSEERRVLNGVTLLYVACIPFDIVPLAFGYSLTAPLALLLMATWVFSSIRRHEKIRFPRSAGTFLFLYCCWIICTIFWSVDSTASITAAQTILLQAPLVVILSNTLGPVWLRSLVTLGCSTSILGLVVLSRPSDALREGRARLSPGINENVTALVLVVGFAALVYAVTRLGGRRAALLVPSALVTGAATLHTGSRAGGIAVAAVLVVALWPLILHGRIRPAAGLRALGIVLAAYISFLIALDAGLLPQRILDLLTTSTTYTDPPRAMINNLFLQTFDHWALFGIGMGNDASYLYITEGTYLNAHSLFWKTWIETGLVGLTLFAAFLFVVIKGGRRSVASQALMPMAVALVIFAITLGGANTSVFWFVIALALTQRPSAQAPTETAQPQTRVGIPTQPSATG